VGAKALRKEYLVIYLLRIDLIGYEPIDGFTILVIRTTTFSVQNSRELRGYDLPTPYSSTSTP